MSISHSELAPKNGVMVTPYFLQCRNNLEMTARRPAGDTDNLVTLPDINEDILLNELKARYRKDDIYVRTV